MSIRAARLYAVCPQCQGKRRQDCTLCRSRGFISKVTWETGIPTETKTLRQNIIDGTKVNSATTQEGPMTLREYRHLT